MHLFIGDQALSPWLDIWGLLEGSHAIACSGGSIMNPSGRPLTREVFSYTKSVGAFGDLVWKSANEIRSFTDCTVRR